MTGVVLRCAACGTTQNHPGECEACLAGEVRYFCGNHDPGLWLDQPACTRCGARFGEAPPRRPEPPRPTTPRPPARERPADPIRPRSGFPEPGPPRARRTPPPHEEPRDDATSLAELLTDMMDERTRTGARIEEAPAPMPMPMPDVRRMAAPVMGCLGRLVVFVLLLIALAVGALFLLLGGG